MHNGFIFFCEFSFEVRVNSCSGFWVFNTYRRFLCGFIELIRIKNIKEQMKVQGFLMAFVRFHKCMKFFSFSQAKDMNN